MEPFFLFSNNQDKFSDSHSPVNLKTVFTFEVFSPDHLFMDRWKLTFYSVDGKHTTWDFHDKINLDHVIGQIKRKLGFVIP